MFYNKTLRRYSCGLCISRGLDAGSPGGLAWLDHLFRQTGGVTSTPQPTTAERTAYRREIWIVLGLSLGQSAVYSIVSIIAKLTAAEKLADQTTTINGTQSERPLLDLVYQLLSIGFALVPVALALYLLTRDPGSPVRRLGLGVANARAALTDLGWGAALAALIGIPGLGFYFLARAIGINTTVAASGLTEYWWTVPVLVLAAAKNALLEQVVVVGFLMTRLRQLGWGMWPTIIASAVLRGSYHLYQGFGGFIGNVVMGVVFAYWFEKKRRLMPLIVAHTLLDISAFVGYELIY